LRLDEALGQIGLPGKNQISRLPPNRLTRDEAWRPRQSAFPSALSDVSQQEMLRSAHGGEVLKFLGDGMLASFALGLGSFACPRDGKNNVISQNETLRRRDHPIDVE
jgi:hypothetical protein